MHSFRFLIDKLMQILPAHNQATTASTGSEAARKAVTEHLMSLDNTHKTANVLQRLRSKLLDLTARNKQLNFWHTKRSCLRITDVLPDQLLEVSLGGRELRFDPVPVPAHEQLIDFKFV